jgi:hypothetical protein
MYTYVCMCAYMYVYVYIHMYALKFFLVLGFELRTLS